MSSKRRDDEHANDMQNVAFSLARINESLASRNEVVKVFNSESG